MTRPQFKPRPISPAGYRAVARRLRAAADHIERLADGQTPREKQARTNVLNSASGFMRIAARRNAGLPALAPDDD